MAAVVLVLPGRTPVIYVASGSRVLCGSCLLLLVLEPIELGHNTLVIGVVFP
jgi:hypothetical protein